MKFILTSYVETPFVDAKNCSEEMKNTLCDSGKAFYNGTIIFTKQLCSTEAPPCTVLGISLSLQGPARLLLLLAALGACAPCPPVGQQCR